MSPQTSREDRVANPPLTLSAGPTERGRSQAVAGAHVLSLRKSLVASYWFKLFYIQKESYCIVSKLNSLTHVEMKLQNTE